MPLLANAWPIAEVSDLLASLADPNLYGWLPECHQSKTVLPSPYYPAHKSEGASYEQNPNSLAWHLMPSLIWPQFIFPALCPLFQVGSCPYPNISSSLLCPHHCSPCLGWHPVFLHRLLTFQDLASVLVSSINMWWPHPLEISFLWIL